MTSNGPHVFLAAPYTQWLDPSTRLVRADLRNRLNRLRRGLIEAGAHVFSAHHNERWGAEWLPAEECTTADFRAMRVADAVCAVVGYPASGGGAVELGWASALGKPVLAVMDDGEDCTPLISGLHTITDVTYLEADAYWSDTFVESVIQATLIAAKADTEAPPHADAESVPGGTGYIGMSGR
ncbi:nucleoside 2-deoxyribosyltransferase [Nocardiopsis sp. LOL_012]|uniref:nucleoside 2-deoxyribosyltransferase n=1 Tax=Nocardiopsis sp. LOL_012 TaxID=3345409 RepID=UPI003A888121